MTAIRSPHSRIFETLVAERRLALVDALTGGVPADHADYRQIVGQIQGLGDALKLSQEADYKLSGDEPDVGG